MIGLSFSIERRVYPDSLMHISGKVDPIIFIKKLYKARAYAMLYRLEYGYEKNPEETRKPNDHFMVLYISQAPLSPFHYLQVPTLTIGIEIFNACFWLFFAVMLFRNKHIRRKLV